MVATYHDRIAILLNPDACIGAPTRSFIRAVWTKHTTTALRQEIRLLQLARRYSSTAVDAACSHVLDHGASLTVDAVKSVLQRSLD